MPSLPEWFRQPLPEPSMLARMRFLLRQHKLHTVCESARCPNMGRCWNKGSATLMILGDRCTRACRFCAVLNAKPLAVDAGEPLRVAEAIKELALRYAVITSVTRDDLADGGASHFAAVVDAVRKASPATKIELLVPDFLARKDSLDVVLAAGPDVLGHNMETVRRLSAALRPQADYDRSLRLLGMVRGRVCVKSGLMVGLGEDDQEVLEMLKELKDAGVDVVAIGQYLAPRADGRQLAVARFVAPDTFDMYRREGLALGFRAVVAGPLVRSSFMAQEAYETAWEAANA